MKYVKTRAFIIGWLLLCCNQVIAAPITFEFSGRVIASWGTLTYLQSEAVRGQFLYDSEWPAFVTTTESAFYKPITPHYGIMLSIGSEVFDSPMDATAADHTLRIDNNRQPFNDARIEDAFTYDTIGIRNYLIVLQDLAFMPSIPDAFTTTSLSQPVVFDAFNNMFGTFQIRSENGNEQLGRIYFSITSVERVAEPATVTLFGLGLAGIVAVRRRRRLMV